MKLPSKYTPVQLAQTLKPLWHYRLLAFIVFVTALSGYLVLQINQAITVPAANAQSQAITTPAPHIDLTVVQQLQQLQDNSVSVQSLFNQERDNPFD